MLETTILNPRDERKYQNWVKHYDVKDIDPQTGEPYDDVNYDTRGYWKSHTPFDRIAGYGPPHFESEHGPDTYKQFGHETFSQESKYARPGEGGMWLGKTFLEQPRMAVSHQQKRRR